MKDPDSPGAKKTQRDPDPQYNQFHIGPEVTGSCVQEKVLKSMAVYRGVQPEEEEVDQDGYKEVFYDLLNCIRLLHFTVPAPVEKRIFKQNTHLYDRTKFLKSKAVPVPHKYVY